MFDTLDLNVDSVPEGLDGPVGDVLLRTHRSYLPLVSPLLEEAGGAVKAMAHGTGGGLTDNLPRVLPPGVAVDIERGAWSPPPVFAFLQRHGGLGGLRGVRTFNMGIGLVVFCAPEERDGLLAWFRQRGESGAAVIGRVTAGEGGVRYP